MPDKTVATVVTVRVAAYLHDDELVSEAADLLVDGYLAEPPRLRVPVHVVRTPHSAARHVAPVAETLVAL